MADHVQTPAEKSAMVNARIRARINQTLLEETDFDCWFTLANYHMTFRTSGIVFGVPEFVTFDEVMECLNNAKRLAIAQIESMSYCLTQMILEDPGPHRYNDILILIENFNRKEGQLTDVTYAIRGVIEEFFKITF